MDNENKEVINENSDTETETVTKESNDNMEEGTKKVTGDGIEEGIEEGMTQTVTADHSEPLSIYGIGPKWSIPCAVLTLIGVIVGHIHPVSTGIPTIKILRYSYIGLGAVLIVLCVKMWVDAVVNANLDGNIMSNKLVTTGVYKYTRNPIYAAVLGILTGVLFISGNTYMYVLPIIFWVFLVQMLKKTEEVWLLEKFGDEYSEYFSKTNRIFPGPQKKK